MGLQLNWLAVKLFAIALALVVQGSTGYGISPSPATFSTIPPIKEGPPDHANRSNAPSPASQPHVLHPPPLLAPLVSPPEPQPIKGVAPSLSPSTPTVFPPQSSIPPPLTGHGVVPSLPPSVPGTKEPKNKNPVTLPVAPATLPPMKSPENPPTFYPIVPGSMPPSSRQNKAPDSNAPLSVPSVPVPTTSPPKELPQKPPPPREPIMPGVPPSNFPAVPVASPSTKVLPISPTSPPPIPMEPPSHLPEPDNSPVLTPSPSATWKSAGIPVAAPPNETPNQFSPVNPSPQKGPSMHKAPRHFNNSVPRLSSPMSPPPNVESDSPALPPISNHKHYHAKDNIPNPAPSSLLLPPPASSPSFAPAPSHPLKSHPKSRQRDNAPPPMNRESHVSPAPAPYPTAPSGQTNLPYLFPKISPSGSLPRNPKMPISPPIRTLPPPPPNEDCSYLACVDPLTNTPPGSPCGCVLPMQVGLRLNVALYTFFPSVSELAEEIAVGVFVKQSQVRIMGANAASQDPEKTIVLIDLVPLEERFDNTTAYLIFQRFWQKKVAISTYLFGNFEILYVRYPGLPPSPPSSISVIDGAPYSGHDNNGRTIHPLGVDVGRRKHKNGLSGSVVAIIVMSASMAMILCCAVAWVLLFRHRDCQQDSTQATLPSLSKPSGITASMVGSGPTSASPSFVSSFATYTGSAKTFSSSNLKKATDNFNASKILGEGGFGRVYNGVLEDGTKVAVKVLKRDDQQGGREFLAEVEMLSRLHHRNLVKLIGICTEERSRCLVYELIPNGSVESHLHGDDRVTAPLDWGSRVKIALGAARGLAYLHEDSSPRVIHRDFKSSNILLEHDFTPKVSDFGLARTALDEENRHISTRVMGTFGYVAPEYAMTGHLLVKSDVYSYGVVLLELLTGRKPVDMSQPPGQENLVSWARSLLTSKEALESIIDPSLGLDFPFDSIAKVAAIASMCVQPEVSHRPFMGEVVQALKLVCNESDDTKEFGSRSCSQEDLSADLDARISANSGQLIDPLQNHSPVSNYGYGSDVERGISTSDLFGSSKMLLRSESFRRHSSSGPLRSGRRRQLWQKMRRLSGGTVSEHGVFFGLWPGSY
ncbi:receptor-like serine/threonine-protein kinase ALE2 isoform X3 [Rhododendron vialii]|uniref:receptor-like serine/threonine-protein kinase ALE2 isoform X3 n=1 Tax=Rhododendron vialii TaxID=182163 RepID=UPI00265D95C2|nr:receptor-like serine/threonine-protein kinase ALE2 isoform X3 [Rhododendron vialii]